jgi:hypothetical protein
LSGTVADAERRLEDSKRECRVLVEELTLLQTQGFELCLVVVGHPRVRSHLSEVEVVDEQIAEFRRQEEW